MRNKVRRLPIRPLTTPLMELRESGAQAQRSARLGARLRRDEATDSEMRGT